MGQRPDKLTPVMFVLVGMLLVVIDLLTKGRFDPFIPLAFFVMAFFEMLFRKQRRVPSNILSLVTAVVFMLALRTYGIDLKIMRTDALAPRVPKDARLVIQKSFWTLSLGDLTLFQQNGDPRNYVGEIRDTSKGPLTYGLIRKTGNSVEYIERPRIKGKVVLVLPTS